MDVMTSRRGGKGRSLYISATGVFYIAIGYEIYRSQDHGESWLLDSVIQPKDMRAALAKLKMPSRLLRYYVSALTLLSDSTRIAVARDGIYRARSGDQKMHCTFRITRGSRPLNIAVDNQDRIVWGEYGDLPREQQICLYASGDGGQRFDVAHAFAPGDIRHVHNVVWDKFDNVYWVMVGDFDKQPGIGRLSKDLKCFDWVIRGSQDARAVGVIVEKDYLYYGTDSELEQNYIVRLDKKTGQISKLMKIEGSSLYASRFGEVRLISTCVEPSKVNRSRQSVLYASIDGDRWQTVCAFEKDCWDLKYFQFGTIVLPTSCYEKSVGMFSGQALDQFDNQYKVITFGGTKDISYKRCEWISIK